MSILQPCKEGVLVGSLDAVGLAQLNTMEVIKHTEAEEEAWERF